MSMNIRERERAFKWLKAFQRNYSAFFLNAPNARRESRNDEGRLPWDRSAFLTDQKSFDIAEKTNINKVGEEDFSSYWVHFNLLSAWRMSKGVYDFEKTLIRYINESQLDTDTALPSRIFTKLPEWCVYIKTPRVSLENREEDIFRETDGFFVGPIEDHETGEVELGFLIDFNKEVVNREAGDSEKLLEDDNYPMWQPFGILFPMLVSLDDALDAAVDHDENDDNKDYEQKDRSEYVEAEFFLNDMVSLVMYLCTDRPDIREDASRPHRGSPTNPVENNPPREALTWMVGTKLSETINMAEREAERPKKNGADESERGSGRSPRPHLRRAHYHTYWVKDGGEEKPVLRWLPPTPVNFNPTSYDTCNLPVRENEFSGDISERGRYVVPESEPRTIKTNSNER